MKQPPAVCGKLYINQFLRVLHFFWHEKYFRIIIYFVGGKMRLQKVKFRKIIENRQNENFGFFFENFKVVEIESRN